MKMIILEDGSLWGCDKSGVCQVIDGLAYQSEKPAPKSFPTPQALYKHLQGILSGLPPMFSSQGWSK